MFGQKRDGPAKEIRLQTRSQNDEGQKELRGLRARPEDKLGFERIPQQIRAQPQVKDDVTGRNLRLI